MMINLYVLNYLYKYFVMRNYSVLSGTQVVILSMYVLCFRAFSSKKLNFGYQGNQ